MSKYFFHGDILLNKCPDWVKKAVEEWKGAPSIFIKSTYKDPTPRRACAVGECTPHMYAVVEHDGRVGNFVEFDDDNKIVHQYTSPNEWIDLSADEIATADLIVKLFRDEGSTSWKKEDTHLERYCKYVVGRLRGEEW